MCRLIVSLMAVTGMVLAVLVVTSIPGFALECPVDMVPVGPICVDKYEASVWSQPPNDDGIPQGDQFGRFDGFSCIPDYPCSANGNDCSDASQPSKKIFAASAEGVKPATCITWFQAQQACANVGKRLLRNGEWQMAAAGTQDPGNSPGAEDCNVKSNSSDLSGSRSNCVSNWGVFDMVGNIIEWVEDWLQGNSNNFTSFNGKNTSGSGYGDDFIFGVAPAQFQGANSENFPTALIRGGAYGFGGGTQAGIFSLHAVLAPSAAFGDIGFRCAK